MRLFHQCVWAALEDAGVNTKRIILLEFTVALRQIHIGSLLQSSNLWVIIYKPFPMNS